METAQPAIRLGVLTSGGDAQGMNAAVRAVVRTALTRGAEPYAIMEGYQGAVDGGAGIRALGWDDVGSILHLGGTIIGTARCASFRTSEGRQRAVENLIRAGIDRLVVIGGDGSLTGTDVLRREWPDHVAELARTGAITADQAAAHPVLMAVGLVGSIDNDLVGSDMTIGADSALHRIIEAIDAISSTAASHQRSFVVEVMGRHCGYLPLMAAVAGGCDYVLVPEAPPRAGWEDDMCDLLRRGRAAGRRESLVLVAEGAADREGNPITAEYVRGVIADRLEDARLTILGHVQRGGTPSAYDRWMSTLLGYRAAMHLIDSDPQSAACILGQRRNRISELPLVETVAETQGVAGLVKEGRFNEAVDRRGGSFTELLEVFGALSAPPRSTPRTGRRIAIVHAGALAPGMNTATRAAVRLGIAAGHTMVGVEGSFAGLAAGRLSELEWGGVEQLVGEGGSSLGTSRQVPSVNDLYDISRSLESAEVDGLIVIGGYSAYESVHLLHRERDRYPALQIPVVAVPASIDNNLPGSELSIGADTALNSAVWALDRIKQSGSASRRCFVAETMGRTCGYLTLLAGLAAGAEQVYLHEHGITLAALQQDVERMVEAFRSGRRLFLAVRNEYANDLYTTDFLVRVFEEEGEDLFDVRSAILGHIQQGGSPSPFDRIFATRLMHRALSLLGEELAGGTAGGWYLGLWEGELKAWPVASMMEQLDPVARRPRHQWWLELEPALRAVSQPAV